MRFLHWWRIEIALDEDLFDQNNLSMVPPVHRSNTQLTADDVIYMEDE